MSLLSWFGIGNSAGNGLANVVTAANDVASQWISNPGERAAQVDKIMEAARRDVESARNFGGAMPGDTGFSAFADGINKLVRPVLAPGVVVVAPVIRRVQRKALPDQVVMGISELLGHETNTLLGS